MQSMNTTAGLPGRVQRLQPGEGVRVDRLAGLGQHQRLALAQQPRVGRADDLAADQQ
jgi:hypothetical protein